MMFSFKFRNSLCAPAHLWALMVSLSCLDVHSQTTTMTDNPTADPVVVIGSRFPNAPDLSPIGASIITATEIRNACVDNVNEAIRKLGGVYGRQNLYGTQDYDLDMNGFGADSYNNLVILVDGVRISENEQNVAVLSSIPIESVARIEIMHGGSSVLYGDGATGGVIQIITRQLGSTPLMGTMVAELGQFQDHAGSAYLTKGWDDFNASLNVSEQKSDNYRANNDVTQKNASGALTWFSSGTRAGIRFDIAHQDAQFPGALNTMAQFVEDPRQTLHAGDNGTLNIDRYTGFFEKTMDDWQFASELSTRERVSDSVFSQTPATYSGRQTEFTPRVRNLITIGAIQNELVLGLDFMNWNRQTTSSYSLAYATQQSHAIYVRDELKSGAARIALGVRRELFDRSAYDPLAYPVQNYQAGQGVNAWELQGSYAFVPDVDVFAKLGQSYRVANVDDNALTLVPNTPLLPQLSHDLELGATLGNNNRQLTARFFQHDITNEIYFDPLIGPYGVNTNLDPTRRQGIALEAIYRLSSQFRLTAQAQHVNAVFTGGVNDGKELVLVPANTLAAHLNWLSGNGQNAYVGAQWVDTQRYGGDFTNTCSQLIPAHASLDARYAHAIGAWEWALTGNNLTNRQYFTNAFECMGGIYPDDGRQMKMTLRYSF